MEPERRPSHQAQNQQEVGDLEPRGQQAHTPALPLSHGHSSTDEAPSTSSTSNQNVPAQLSPLDRWLDLTANYRVTLQDRAQSNLVGRGSYGNQSHTSVEAPGMQLNGCATAFAPNVGHAGDIGLSALPQREAWSAAAASRDSQPQAPAQAATVEWSAMPNKHEATVTSTAAAQSSGGQRSLPEVGTAAHFLHVFGQTDTLSSLPNLSTAEHTEFTSNEAFAQAEEAIIVDLDEAGSVAGESTEDDGYESNSVTSASTSAVSSIRDYMYENGRRYHSFREGAYNFPNDDVEQGREDMKHATIKLLCNQQLHFAPIGDYPQEILDMGTGTGIWAIEMGEMYSSANVLGVDLSPIQPEWVPPNVRFQVDDVESSWLHPRNHFDFIHSRHTVQAFRDWPRLLRRSMEHLKPGGYIELQEILHQPFSMRDETGAMPPDHPVSVYWAHIRAGLAERGVDFNAVEGGRLSDRVRQAGFVNVTERVLQVPLGTWPKNKVLKTVGLYWRTILLDGIQAIALGPLTRGLGWNREQVEVFLMDVRRAYYDNATLMYMPMHIIYGQKPHGVAFA